MDNEYRAHTSGGMDRAGTGAHARSGVSDRFTIGELAHESGVTLRLCAFTRAKVCWPRSAMGAPVVRESVCFISG